MEHRQQYTSLWSLFLCIVVIFVPITGYTDNGKQLYEKRCGMCHALPDPKQLSSEQWILKLDEMAPNAGLSGKKKGSVLSYLQEHSKKALTMVSMVREQKLFEDKCNLCHTTDRIFLMPLTNESRRHIVLRMQERAQDLITVGEADEILDYLSRGAPGAKKPLRKEIDGEPAEKFRARCTACHTAERVFLALQESQKKGMATEWLHVVNRMREKAPDWIDEEEADEILEYLNALKPVTIEE